MKVNELTRELRKAGCYLLRHGSRHDVWYSPKTKDKALIPRHGSAEVKKKTEANIRRKLFGA